MEISTAPTFANRSTAAVRADGSVERRADGLCGCGKPAAARGSLCATHAELHRRNKAAEAKRFAALPTPAPAVRRLRTPPAVVAQAVDTIVAAARRAASGRPLAARSVAAQRDRFRRRCVAPACTRRTAVSSPLPFCGLHGPRIPSTQ